MCGWWRATGSRKVECRGPETLHPRLRKGQKAAIKSTAYPDEMFDGEICFFAPEVDRDVTSVLAKIQLSKADPRLLPGMFARVTTDLGR